MALKIILTRGLQASGKTSWAKEQLNLFPGVYKNICKDDLRRMLDDSRHSDANEQFVLNVRDFLIVETLNSGKSVIVSDTNFEPVHEATIRQIVTGWNRDQENKGKKTRATVEIKDFNISLEDAIERDKGREYSVGEKVIRRTYNQFVRPKGEKMTINKAEAPIYNPDLPDAIICDLDGTLALLNGRDPYDASACENDEVNIPVIGILKSYNRHAPFDVFRFANILFVSGREEKI